MGIFLRKNGFTDFIAVGNTPALLIRMLEYDRADAYFGVRPKKNEVLNSDSKAVNLFAVDVIHTERIWLVG